MGFPSLGTERRQREILRKTGLKAGGKVHEAPKEGHFAQQESTEERK